MKAVVWENEALGANYHDEEIPDDLKEKPAGAVTLTISKDGPGPGAGAIRTVTFDPEGTAPGAGPRRHAFRRRNVGAV